MWSFSRPTRTHNTHGPPGALSRQKGETMKRSIQINLTVDTDKKVVTAMNIEEGTTQNCEFIMEGVDDPESYHDVAAAILAELRMM